MCILLVTCFAVSYEQCLISYDLYATTIKYALRWVKAGQHYFIQYTCTRRLTLRITVPVVYTILSFHPYKYQSVFVHKNCAAIKKTHTQNWHMFVWAAFLDINTNILMLLYAVRILALYIQLHIYIYIYISIICLASLVATASRAYIITNCRV